MKKYYYKTCGLQICSEIVLPELNSSLATSCDIKILLKTIQDDSLKFSSSKSVFSSGENVYTFTFDSLGIIRVRNGTEIEVFPDTNPDLYALRQRLYGEGLSGIIFQRGDIPFHASAVKGPRNAIALVGPSGAGKSSIAFAFGLKGYSILADDLVAVRCQNTKKPVLYPGIQSVRLYPDTIAAYQKSYDFQVTHAVGLKSYVELHQPATEAPVELDRIIIVRESRKDDQKIREIRGSEKLDLLLNHTIKIYYLRDKLQGIKQFNSLSQLASQCKVFLLERHEENRDFMGLAELITKTV